MEWIEKEGYKLFKFIERVFILKLHKLVSDWVKDKNGTVWLLGVKSFELTPDSWKQKVYNPTPTEKEMLFRNRH